MSARQVFRAPGWVVSEFIPAQAVTEAKAVLDADRLAEAEAAGEVSEPTFSGCMTGETGKLSDCTCQGGGGRGRHASSHLRCSCGHHGYSHRNSTGSCFLGDCLCISFHSAVCHCGHDDFDHDQGAGICLPNSCPCERFQSAPVGSPTPTAAAPVPDPPLAPEPPTSQLLQSAITHLRGYHDELHAASARSREVGRLIIQLRERAEELRGRAFKEAKD